MEMSSSLPRCPSCAGPHDLLQIGDAASGLFVPSERLSRLEETATYRQSMKDAQDEARSYHTLLLNKQMSGFPLNEEERRSLLMAEKLLSIQLTLGDAQPVKMHAISHSNLPSLAFPGELPRT